MPGLKLRRYQRIFWKTAFTGIFLIFLGMYFYCLYIVHVSSTQRVEIFETAPHQLGLKAETISLISSDDIILKAWWIPSREPSSPGSVILLHGTESMDASSMLGHAKFLHDAGYGALVLDMRAHGRSGGQRTGWAIEEPQDVIAALDWMKENSLSEQPIAILGISTGGATAIRTAALRPEVGAVISIGSFASLDRLFRTTVAKKLKVPRNRMTVLTPFMHLSTATLFGDWPRTASPLNDIKKIPPRPVFIVHGEADDQIPVEHAYLLARATKGKAQLWIVKGGGHIFLSGDSTGFKDTLYRKNILKFLDENLPCQIEAKNQRGVGNE